MALGFRGFLHTARGGGEERKGGMGVTWRKHDKHVVRRHAISYPVEMHLSLSSFFSLLFVLVRSSARNENERTRFLMAFRCYLINSNEFLLFRGNTCFDSTLNFRLYYFSESRDTWPSKYIFIFIPGE